MLLINHTSDSHAMFTVILVALVSSPTEFYEGERLVRKEFSNRVEHYEGEPGNERMVRHLVREGELSRGLFSELIWILVLSYE